MRRGELYRVAHPQHDPRPARIFVVVSRQPFLDVRYSSAACVPVYTTIQGIDTEVILDENNGLKHRSAARCDEVTSLPRAVLTDFVGTVSESQLRELSAAVALALDIRREDLAD